MVKANGGRWLKSHQHRPMRDACTRAKIQPPVSFHTLRHTWASLVDHERRAADGGRPEPWPCRHPDGRAALRAPGAELCQRRNPRCRATVWHRALLQRCAHFVTKRRTLAGADPASIEARLRDAYVNACGCPSASGISTSPCRASPPSRTAVTAGPSDPFDDGWRQTHQGRAGGGCHGGRGQRCRWPAGRPGGAPRARHRGTGAARCRATPRVSSSGPRGTRTQGCGEFTIHARSTRRTAARQSRPCRGNVRDR